MYLTRYFDEIQQWYVVFHPRVKPRHRWIHWLVRRDMAHCHLARELPGGHTLVVDAWQWGIAVHVVEKSIDEYLIEQAQGTPEMVAASAVLGFTADYRRLGDYRTRGVYTCVTLTKAVLGLWKCAQVQTPMGLYKLLLKYPTCTVVKPYVPFLQF